MALLKAFVCQVVLFGLYKLFLEQVVVDHLVPDELTRNCLVGFVCLLCFGIQLYTEHLEELASQAAAAKAKSRRRKSSDTAARVSEILDERTVHMMRTLDAAMQNMPMSEGYGQHVLYTSSGRNATVSEHTFSKQPDVVVIEEIHVTKLDDVIFANDTDKSVSANEPIAVPLKIEEVTNESEEEEEDEETETKSDAEEDVVTVIDVSKPKPEATESEEEEEEEKELVNENKKKIDDKPEVKSSKVEEEEDEEEEEEEEEEEKDLVKNNNKKDEKPAVKSLRLKEDDEEDEEEEEEEESEEEVVEVKKETRQRTRNS